MAGNFFGRRKAKPLKPAQQRAHDQVVPGLLVDITREAPKSASCLFSHQPEKVVLEIGFGGGEHFVHRAGLHPEAGFIGCEPFINGMAKAARDIAANSLTNVRLYNEDATELLQWLPDACLDRIDLLYPDPWPKKRHWKRRFLNSPNLQQFHRLLIPGGEFRFASDMDSYVNWALRHAFDHGGFGWRAKTATDWQRPWEEWISTRYEQKAIREGRKPCYLIFEKR